MQDYIASPGTSAIVLIFFCLLEAHRLVPESTLYVEDVPANVEGAKASGLATLQFVSPAKLRSDLAELGLL